MTLKQCWRLHSRRRITLKRKPTIAKAVKNRVGEEVVAVAAVEIIDTGGKVGVVAKDAAVEEAAVAAETRIETGAPGEVTEAAITGEAALGVVTGEGKVAAHLVGSMTGGTDQTSLRTKVPVL